MTHELKTWPAYFDAVAEGDKTFEVRKNDRNFKIGDMLMLREWDNIRDEYTGRTTYFEITYIFHGGHFGIEEGYVVMAIK